ncbi:phospholipase A1 [Drosophila gunungcola]|uniref:phospholipase A1 n=1 Tax=Drosophila gunungcola TaxID=103775 RepID=UPI0022E37498|nr:phospholipase A1 [Drosophila gunungcola]
MMYSLWSLLFFIVFSNQEPRDEPGIEVSSFEDEGSMGRCWRLRDEKCPNPDINFWLFTKANPYGMKLSLDNLPIDKFLPLKPLKVLIHGFDGHRHYTPNFQLRPRFLELDINVISLDFPKLVKSPCYSEAVHNAKYVGRCTAHFLTTLLERKLVAIEGLHLIGFGLGAHVAGFVGNLMTKYHLEHITGLDPAKPYYLVNDTAEKLDRSDAKFVDVVHTDVMMMGLLEALGHVDFYVNMGVTQPNCGAFNNMDTHYCYHNRSAEYYAESITTPIGFIGYFCPNFKSFATGVCVPKEDTETMGFHAHPQARGRYFLDTNKSPPYAMGKNYMHLNRQLKGKTFLNDDIIERILENNSIG